VVARHLDDPQAQAGGGDVGLGPDHRQGRRQGDVAQGAVDGELQREELARRRRDEADHLVTATGQVVRRGRRAMPGQVVGAGAGGLLQHPHPTGDHGAVLQVADPQHAVDALAHQVHQPVALAQVQFQVWIALQEGRQARQQEMAGQGPVHVHPQQPARLGVAELGLGVLQVGQDRQAAPVEGLAVQGGTDVARGPLQQPRAQPALQLLDPLSGGGGRQVQVQRRLAEAAALHDPDEQPHGVETVQDRAPIIRLSE
jgi:hypothetical protein